MKIMTFNIQHGLDYLLRLQGIRKVNFEKIAFLINEYKADIVSFNEIYNSGDEIEFGNQIKKIANLCNYPYYSFSKAIDTKNGEYGNAIMSKVPFELKRVYKIDDPLIKDENVFYESRVISSYLFQKFTLYNTHFGLAKSEQNNAFTCFEKIMNEEKANKIVFLGDFNIEPMNEIILKLKEKFNEVTDYFNSEFYTYPSNNPVKKIDYIFVSKDIKIISSETIKQIISDHLPIICEIEL